MFGLGCGPDRTTNDDDDDDDDSGEIEEVEDADGDGYCAAAECEDEELRPDDCDDSDPNVYPGAEELCDRKDNDCDDEVDENFDADGDGFVTEDEDECRLSYDATELDCNDFIATIHPGAEELCDGNDNDCNNLIDDGLDNDRDGHLSCAGDCDDTEATVNPLEIERDHGCDGLDNDCNGIIDDGGNGTAYDGIGDEFEDSDFDNFTVCEGDCDDLLVGVNPDAVEACDELDNDCDGLVDEDLDLDGDGWPDAYPNCAAEFGEVDCDDSDPNVYPGAPEICDMADNNCNGQIDENLDFDNDGFTSCEGDCEPLNGAINPTATEDCDGLDNDCDGIIDNGWDGDGDLQSSCAGDCDDTDPTVYSGAPQICDDGILDNDCDGQTDVVDVDVDNDGETECEGDCDETSATVNTSAPEVCNVQDDDCDGVIPADELDADNDGFISCTPYGCNLAVVADQNEAAFWTNFAGFGPLGLDTLAFVNAATSGVLEDADNFDGAQILIVYTLARGFTSDEHAVLDAWVDSGKSLIITGPDAMSELPGGGFLNGGDEDAIADLADLARSVTTGDANPPTALCTVSNTTTPVTNGSFGAFGLSTTFTAVSANHDNAIADLGRGAVRVASVGNKAKIIWTNVIGGGYVMYWNGNAGLTEWDGVFNTDLQDMLLNGLEVMNQNCSPLGLLGGDCDDTDATAYPGVCP
jgi:hypothetical protein